MTQPRKFKTKAAARQAFEARLAEFTGQHLQSVATYLNNMHAALADHDAGDGTLFGVLRLHLPEERHMGLNGVCCPTCADNYDDLDPAPHEWPCQTYAGLAAALKLPAVAEMGRRPEFKDFWTDPYVTVTFAHLTSAQSVYEAAPRYYAPNEQATLTLAEARRIKHRLVASSMKRIEDLL